MRRVLRGLIAAGLLVCAGCVAGPDYAGGPSAEEPHGIVTPGQDVTIWAVGGKRTTTTSFDIKVAPGRRVLWVRLEHPVESDSAKPYEEQQLSLRVEDGVAYHFERKRERLILPPYEVSVTQRRIRAAMEPSE